MAAFGGYYRDGNPSGSRPLTGKRVVSHVLFLCAFTYILFEERFTISVNTGGRGELQPVDLLLPLVGLFLFLGGGGVPGPWLLRLKTRGLFWVPYVALSVVLPVLGVFLRGEPPRTMFLSIQGLIEISFFLFGAWGAFSRLPLARLAQWYAWCAVILECATALMDYLNKTGIYPTAIGEFLLQWNVASEGALSEYTTMTWRSVGTFVNPNDLGFWSVVAFWMAALMFRGWFCFTGVIAALLTLVLSESRGSMISLFGTCAVWLVYLALSRDARLKKARDTTYVSAILVFLVVGWLGAALSQSDGVQVTDKFSVITRFERGLNVLTGGADADSNASARVSAWHLAMAFFSEHPSGTWVSPRLKFHLYIDNEFVKTLLQGSIPYLFALIMVIVGSVRRLGAPGPAAKLLAMIIVTAAVNGMSAYPFSYPAMGVFWILLGYDLATEQRHREALRRASAQTGTSAALMHTEAALPRFTF